MSSYVINCMSLYVYIIGYYGHFANQKSSALSWRLRGSGSISWLNRTNSLLKCWLFNPVTLVVAEFDSDHSSTPTTFSTFLHYNYFATGWFQTVSWNKLSFTTGTLLDGFLEIHHLKFPLNRICFEYTVCSEFWSSGQVSISAKDREFAWIQHKTREIMTPRAVQAQEYYDGDSAVRWGGSVAGANLSRMDTLMYGDRMYPEII